MKCMMHCTCVENEFGLAILPCVVLNLLRLPCNECRIYIKKGIVSNLLGKIEEYDAMKEDWSQCVGTDSDEKEMHAYGCHRNSYLWSHEKYFGDITAVSLSCRYLCL